MGYGGGGYAKRKPYTKNKLDQSNQAYTDNDLWNMGDLLDGSTDWEEIDFSRNKLSSVGLREVLRLGKRCQYLRVLRLFRNNIDDRGAEELAAFISECPALEEIHLSHNYITGDGAALLVAAADNARSRHAVPFWLRLEQNCVSEPGVVLHDLQLKLSVCVRADETRCTNRSCYHNMKVHVPLFLQQKECTRNVGTGGWEDRGSWDDFNGSADVDSSRHAAKGTPIVVLTPHAEARAREHSRSRSCGVAERHTTLPRCRALSSNEGHKDRYDSFMERRPERSAERRTHRVVDRGVDRFVERPCERERFIERTERLERGGESFAERGTERFVERGGNRFVERGVERFVDRGGERYVERGNERFSERGADRFVERGGERVEGGEQFERGARSERLGERFVERERSAHEQRRAVGSAEGMRREDLEDLKRCKQRVARRVCRKEPPASERRERVPGARPLACPSQERGIASRGTGHRSSNSCPIRSPPRALGVFHGRGENEARTPNRCGRSLQDPRELPRRPHEPRHRAPAPQDRSLQQGSASGPRAEDRRAPEVRGQASTTPRARGRSATPPNGVVEVASISSRGSNATSPESGDEGIPDEAVSGGSVAQANGGGAKIGAKFSDMAANLATTRAAAATMAVKQPRRRAPPREEASPVPRGSIPVAISPEDSSMSSAEEEANYG